MKSMAVALGGAIGAVLRYSIGVLTAGSGTFPYGTVTVNLAGSFGIALAYCFFQSHSSAPHTWRLFVITGVLGGFTTFSAFSWEWLQIWKQAGWVGGTAYGLLQGAGAFLCCMGGLAAGQWLWGR
ncbi:CrcB family protein [Megasphaera lornae]|uniref:Fluoride-specific ion channel FluC n=1 Tax=Megasphaera lornae TaxID=1000568 RepID=A0ABN0D093_9FIRM|nr:CrcB family protein [Megasphaera lornae]EGL40667.1 putative protein CrcB [Megasphaera lornae]MUP49960.1 CrcB family protein [Veillonellaceae bacterium M1-70]